MKNTHKLLLALSATAPLPAAVITAANGSALGMLA